MTDVRRTYVPPAFGRTPQTPAEALEAAACLLEEEGRWGKGAWFEHDNPEHADYDDNPYCNGWHACADGALQIVTIGVERLDDDGCSLWWTGAVTPYDYAGAPPEHPLYVKARAQLEDTLARLYGDPVRHIPQFNDKKTTSREDVVNAFREAAADARNNETEPPK